MHFWYCCTKCWLSSSPWQLDHFTALPWQGVQSQAWAPLLPLMNPFLCQEWPTDFLQKLSPGTADLWNRQGRGEGSGLIRNITTPRQQVLRDRALSYFLIFDVVKQFFFLLILESILHSKENNCQNSAVSFSFMYLKKVFYEPSWGTVVICNHLLFKWIQNIQMISHNGSTSSYYLCKLRTMFNPVLL